MPSSSKCVSAETLMVGFPLHGRPAARSPPPARARRRPEISEHRRRLSPRDRATCVTRICGDRASQAAPHHRLHHCHRPLPPHHHHHRSTTPSSHWRSLASIAAAQVRRAATPAAIGAADTLVLVDQRAGGACSRSPRRASCRPRRQRLATPDRGGSTGRRRRGSGVSIRRPMRDEVPSPRGGKRGAAREDDGVARGRDGSEAKRRGVPDKYGVVRDSLSAVKTRACRERRQCTRAAREIRSSYTGPLRLDQEADVASSPHRLREAAARVPSPRFALETSESAGDNDHTRDADARCRDLESIGPARPTLPTGRVLDDVTVRLEQHGVRARPRRWCAQRREEVAGEGQRRLVVGADHARVLVAPRPVRRRSRSARRSVSTSSRRLGQTHWSSSDFTMYCAPEASPSRKMWSTFSPSCRRSYRAPYQERDLRGVPFPPTALQPRARRRRETSTLFAPVLPAYGPQIGSSDIKAKRHPKSCVRVATALAHRGALVRESTAEM